MVPPVRRQYQVIGTIKNLSRRLTQDIERSRKGIKSLELNYVISSYDPNILHTLCRNSTLIPWRLSHLVPIPSSAKLTIFLLAATFVKTVPFSPRVFSYLTNTFYPSFQRYGPDHEPQGMTC